MQLAGLEPARAQCSHEPESCAYANSATTAQEIISNFIPLKAVQLRGLEPLPKYMDMNLNHARMPIPPQLHIDTFKKQNAVDGT